MAIIVFIAAVILLIWKPIHPILIGASIPTTLALLGILDAKRAFSDFANTTVIFFMSLLVIGGAIFKTGLADFIGEKLIGLLGKSERGIMLGSGIVASGLSAFLNDTGTTGCLIPIVSSMAKKAQVPLSKVLMSLAFFASLGGTITLIGTTPHIVADGLLTEAGYEAFGFFEFAKIGLPITIAGLIYMYFIGIKLMPVKDITEDNLPELAERDPKKMVIVAGIFPLSTALIETGAADYIVDNLSVYLTDLSPTLLYAAISGITILLTQFLMNTSLTAILVPMAILVAESANMDPRGAVMAVAMAASAALCTPFGTGPNLLVWEVGGYDFQDYMKVGLPLAIIFWMITTIACVIIYGA